MADKLTAQQYQAVHNRGGNLWSAQLPDPEKQKFWWSG